MIILKKHNLLFTHAIYNIYKLNISHISYTEFII